MSDLAFDHVYVWCARGAPEAERLEGAGFRVGERVTRHAGMGTASRSVLFADSYLELLWVEDESELAIIGATAGSDYLARSDWRDSGASPFGFAFRRIEPDRPLPFPAVSVRAAWMRPGTALRVAGGADRLGRPVLFVVPPYMAVPTLLAARPELARRTRHPNGAGRITGVRAGMAELEDEWPAAAVVGEQTVVELRPGEPHRLELELDGGRGGEEMDLAPELPIRLRL